MDGATARQKYYLLIKTDKARDKSTNRLAPGVAERRESSTAGAYKAAILMLSAASNRDL